MTRKILYLGLDPENYHANGILTHFPIILIIPRPLSDSDLSESFRKFDQYSHVIMTSKSSVAILSNYMTSLNISLKMWREKKTLAIGEVTAKHLLACGIVPFKIAKEETGEGLIEELKLLPLDKSYVFFPHSAQARPVIKNFLIENKIHHHSCVLYETQANVHAQIPSLHEFDELVFTSPSTIDAFLVIFGKIPAHLSLTSIGPITSRYLAKVLQDV